MTNVVYFADELVHISVDELWANLPKNTLLTVKFHDGEAQMVSGQIIFSHYLWALHRQFPAKVSVSHALTGYYAHSKYRPILGKIFWDVFNQQPNPKAVIWEMSAVVMDIGNSLWNMSFDHLADKVTSCCIYDLLEVLEEPDIHKAKIAYNEAVPAKNYELAEEDIKAQIENVYGEVSKKLYAPEFVPSLATNAIRKMCRADIVSKGQMLQLIGPRGFTSDINGHTFKYPIDTGYAEGMRYTYDAVTESRSAAKSLLMNKVPLQQSEYFNRRMQQFAAVIEGVDETIGPSCTGFKTMPWLVEEQDLKLLKGLNYMDGDKPVMIWDSIDHLVGKIIELRTIAGCNAPDPQRKCATCVGHASLTLPPDSALGYYLISDINSEITQLTLSNKHHEASTASLYLTLEGAMQKWFRHDRSDRSRLVPKADRLRKPFRIYVPSRYARNLNQIKTLDLNDLPPSRVTSFRHAQIVHLDAHGDPISTPEDLSLELGGSGAHLSTEMLRYLRDNGWESTKEFISFDVVGWNKQDPIFITPRRGDNIYLYLQEIKRFMFPTKGQNVGITSYISVNAATYDFVQLLRKRLTFNLSGALVYIVASMTVRSGGKSYRMARAEEDYELVDSHTCLANRSLSAALAYQDQPRTLGDTHWYNPDRAETRHPLDGVLQQD